MQNEPVLEIDRKGNKRWRLNGEFHREDGPAIELVNGNKSWWLNGELHREDGPAVVDENGDKEWYLNDKVYTFEEWLELIQISDQEKIKLRLKYAK